MDRLYDMPGHLIRRAQQISMALFAEECAEFDLTSVQYAALVGIRLYPNVDGERLLRRVEPAVRRVQHRLLEPLIPADRAALLRLLAQLATVHNDVTSIPLRTVDRG